MSRASSRDARLRSRMLSILARRSRASSEPQNRERLVQLAFLEGEPAPAGLHDGGHLAIALRQRQILPAFRIAQSFVVLPRFSTATPRPEVSDRQKLAVLDLLLERLHQQEVCGGAIV